MRIEILYPELGNLYGDSGNVKYLACSLPGAEFIYTTTGDEPAFVSNKSDLLYLGPMTEKGQILALNSLCRYKEAFIDNIEQGTHCLFTGNSFELLGKYIKTNRGIEMKALGLVDMYSVCDTRNRHNSIFLGIYDSLPVCGFNSRFSHSFPGSTITGFCELKRGIGLNPSCSFEGLRIRNFIGTYLLGPLLALNPLLTQKLFNSLGCYDLPAFFEEAVAAYNKRIAEFSNPAVKLD